MEYDEEVIEAPLVCVNDPLLADKMRLPPSSWRRHHPRLVKGKRETMMDDMMMW